VFEKKQPIKITDPHLALMKMQGWCAYQERCQHDARNKLYELGLWPEAVENIIVKLIEENFINEERFAIQFAKGKFNIKKWGRVKIKQELKQKRVSDYCLKKALQQIDEEDYLATLTKVIATKKRVATEKNPIKLKFKLATYAISRGFERDLIFDILNLTE
jgi:regulatory protein